MAAGAVDGIESLFVAYEIDLVVVVGGVGPELGCRYGIGQFQLDRLAGDQRHPVGGGDIATPQITSPSVVIAGLKNHGPGVPFVGDLD